eukprot:gene13404-biopygen11657
MNPKEWYIIVTRQNRLWEGKVSLPIMSWFREHGFALFFCNEGHFEIPHGDDVLEAKLESSAHRDPGHKLPTMGAAAGGAAAGSAAGCRRCSATRGHICPFCGPLCGKSAGSRHSASQRPCWMVPCFCFFAAETPHHAHVPPCVDCVACG